MLGALFSSFQTSLGQVFSKPFAMGSLLPILLFLGACAGLATELGGSAKDWAVKVTPLLSSPASAGWTFTVWLVAVLTISLLWSGLNGFLLELLEGKHLGVVARIFYASQVRRAEDIDNQIRRLRRELAELDRPARGAAALPAAQYELKRRLRTARATGEAKSNTAYPADRRHRLWSILLGKHGARDLTRVRWRRITGQVNTLSTLQPAVAALETELATGNSTPLEFDHVELLRAIDDSRERLRFELQRLMNLRQFTYPTVSNANRGTTALTVLAPTRLGNLTRTMRSYALDRYGMDLDIFWTRLQRVLLKEIAFYSTLSDAKSQVDFLVSTTCLVIIFTGFWSIYLLWVQPAPRQFLMVASLGPIAARLLYLITCQNYLVFADLMRSSVDHFRFDLLDALHLQHPPGNREEVLQWSRAGEWMGYGNDVDVTFRDKP
jgi:hypothetical protein